MVDDPFGRYGTPRRASRRPVRREVPNRWEEKVRFSAGSPSRGFAFRDEEIIVESDGLGELRRLNKGDVVETPISRTAVLVTGRGIDPLALGRRLRGFGHRARPNHVLFATQQPM
ncbi:MAG: hypothetical protein WKF45_00185, partial [Ilumatobacteraceae bacterium]